MKIFLRFLILIFLTAGFLFGGYVVGWYAKFNLYDAWKIKQLKKQGDQIWQELLREALKDDVYGSQSSPEETFLMFLDALKKEDLELASKYFWPDMQEEWLNIFKKAKQDDKLKKFVIDLQNVKSKNSGKDLYYVLLDEEGIISATIEFKLNPITKIWKISSF